MPQYKNHLQLSGTIATDVMHSHIDASVHFYSFFLDVPRLSGAHDMLPVMASESVMDVLSPQTGLALRLEGRVRSDNVMVDGKNRLQISAFAEHLAPITGGEDTNAVTMSHRQRQRSKLLR